MGADPIMGGRPNNGWVDPRMAGEPTLGFAHGFGHDVFSHGIL